MVKLPQIPNKVKVFNTDVISLRGINFSDSLRDGDLADSKNISARRYPYISTRKAREQLTDYSEVTALTSWDKLVAVQGTDLLYDGNVVGQVSEGEKQFAVVNTKLVIWPDKKYLDLNTLNIYPLGAEVSGTGAEFGTDTITISWNNVDLTNYFKVGDGVEISGCTAEEGNNFQSLVIKEMTATTLTFRDNAFTEATETGTIKFARNIPDLDYICESENRLWGCSNDTQTIYASALGDPTNFYVSQTLSTDSWAVPVGSEGNFTGCIKLSSSILFWKETKLHKLLGSYPAEYALYSYDMEGLQEGCYKSMQIINDVLFYMGLHGVYAYSGNTPSLMSANFGEKHFTDAVAGNDGDSYYLSVKDGDKYRLLIYEAAYRLWVHEDDIRCIDFARIGKDLYFADSDGNVWLAVADHDDPDLEWFVQFTPFYESTGKRNTVNQTVLYNKIYSKLLLRVQLPKGSHFIISVRQDSGAWREAGQIVGGKRDVVSIRIPLTRCDMFELKFSGKGPCTVLSFRREYSIGSEV